MHWRTKLAAASFVFAVLWPPMVIAQTDDGADHSASSASSAGAGEAQPRAVGDDSAGPAQSTEADNGTTTPGKSAPTRRGASTELEEVVVEAERPLSAASSQVIRTRDFAMRPHSTTQEILNNVPGLVVVQHQGGGKAVQYLIRGFDADHGTDFALFTDGIPVNLVSHAHGQGYADLNYVIPETVKNLELFKGPYFVDLGDFATAGALKIGTKDEFAQNFALAEGGYFDTQRYVLGGSPKFSWGRSLLAAEAYFTNGPFENPQNYARYNVFTKLTLEPTDDRRLSMLGSVYSGDWDGSGQIPVRATNGPDAISRFGSIDPSEGGKTDRENLSIQYTYKPDAATIWDAQLWGSRYSLRLFSDFTFFRETGLRFIGLPSGGVVDTCTADGCAPVDPTADYIPGDGILQQDQGRLFFGGHATYTKFWSLFSLPVIGQFPMETQLGMQMRRDYADVSLFRQVKRHVFFQVSKSAIVEQSVSGFWGQQFFFTDWARLEAGVRGDVFFFDVGNRLPTQEPDRNFTAMPVSGTNTSGLASPKVNVVLGPYRDTELYLNYGNGFHSNDARVVVQANENGLTPANGYEIGSRTRQFDRLDAAAALWLLDLKSEQVFSGDAGTFEPSGPTRRWGVDFETRYQFTSWLYGDFDITWDDPRFKGGGAIPLAPTLLINGGITAELPNGFSGALRVRHLGQRPANEERTLYAQGWTLLDLLLRYRWRNIEASLSFLNLTDTEWREAQFADATCLRTDENGNPNCPNAGNGAGIDGITFTPGNPFNIRGGLQISF